MTAPFDTSVIAPLAIGALIAWRLYARMRRVIGRQRLSVVRPWITAIVFPLLIAVFLVGSLLQPEAPLESTAALLLGAALGIGLGRYGMRLTKFEATPAGLFYTPNVHLGIALTLLLLLRIAYRLMRLHLNGHGLDAPSMQMSSSPLTLAIFGTLGAYYATYAVGLLRWRASVRPRD